MSAVHISSRLGCIKPSITMAVTAKAKQLVDDGIDVTSFGAGEPDFDTPAHIKQAAREGLDRGVAKYTHVQGLVELRRAVAAELERVHGLTFPVEQVIVNCGAKHGLYNLFQCILDEGDEVIIPAPYWVSYPDMVALAGGVPKLVETTAADGFAVSKDKLLAAVSARTRALVLNTPSNPTGAIYTRKQLEIIAEVAVANDLLVISDDIYRSLIYAGSEYVSICSLGPEVAARTVIVDGVSKTYAMTGWRIGYTAGPAPIIKAMSTLQGQSTSGASHIAQVAAVAALTGPQHCVSEMRAAFDERRKEIVRLLREIPGISCTDPRGAFYAFPDVSAYIGRKTPDGRVIADDIELATYLLEAGQVAVVPGSGFGAPGFARLSYACSLDDIQRGLKQMRGALERLK